MNKYVTKKQFARISKGKEVKSFRNPRFKEVEGQEYYITDGIVCEIEKLEEKHFAWYTGYQFDEWKKKMKEIGESSDVYVLSTVDEWFPTELIAGTVPIYIGCGIVRERVCMNTPLAKKTGWIQGGNLGSASAMFRASKVGEAIKILNENGYNFKMS